MRGRKPSPLAIPSHDRTILEQVARSESLPWYQVRRARTVLAIAQGQRTSVVAFQMQCDVETVRRTCQRYRKLGLDGLLEPARDRAARPGFPPLQRAQIVQLACLEPVAKGLHITHWTSQDLARQAVERWDRPGHQRSDGPKRSSIRWTSSRIALGIGGRLGSTRSSRSVPRRSSGATPTPSGWPGGASGWSVPMRSPTSRSWSAIRVRHSIPGSIAQREFDYTRHGTVNILFFLIVHSGRMEAACFDAKSAEHYVRELRAFRHRHRHLRGVYLIHDNDPTHTAAEDERLPGGMLRLVAESLHPGPRLVARRGGVVDRCVRLPLPEARIVAQSGRVHRLCGGKPGRSTIGCTPIRSNGHGRVRR